MVVCWFVNMQKGPGRCSNFSFWIVRAVFLRPVGHLGMQISYTSLGVFRTCPHSHFSHLPSPSFHSSSLVVVWFRDLAMSWGPGLVTRTYPISFLLCSVSVIGIPFLFFFLFFIHHTTPHTQQLERNAFLVSGYPPISFPVFRFFFCSMLFFKSTLLHLNLVLFSSKPHPSSIHPSWTIAFFSTFFFSSPRCRVYKYSVCYSYSISTLL